MFELIIFAA